MKKSISVLWLVFDNFEGDGIIWNKDKIQSYHTYSKDRCHCVIVHSVYQCPDYIPQGVTVQGQSHRWQRSSPSAAFRLPHCQTPLAPTR